MTNQQRLGVLMRMNY